MLLYCQITFISGEKVDFGLSFPSEDVLSKFATTLQLLVAQSSKGIKLPNLVNLA
jgi:hypothetical protein